MSFVEVGGARLEHADHPARDPGRSPFLLLHEGLGSVSLWRDFPRALAQASGARVVAYSREGFGRSSARRRPFTPRFVHEEAWEVLPALRDALGLERPVVLGHSTGASMALLHAARFEAAAVVAIAPLIDVEPSNLAAIRAARDAYYATSWRERLARHHDDGGAVFRGWSDTWLSPAFAGWTIAPELATIRAPILAILGGRDEYATPAQVERLRAAAPGAARFESLSLPEAGHAPHREAAQAVLEAVARFVGAV